MQHEHTRVSFAQGEEVVNISHYEEGGDWKGHSHLSPLVRRISIHPLDSKYSPLYFPRGGHMALCTLNPPSQILFILDLHSWHEYWNGMCTCNRIAWVYRTGCGLIALYTSCTLSNKDKL